MANNPDALCPICGNAEPAQIYDIEIPEIYDGSLIMHCVACGHDWPRFPEGRLHRRALDMISLWDRPEAP